MASFASRLAQVLFDQNCHLGTFEICTDHLLDPDGVRQSLEELGCLVDLSEDADLMIVTCPGPRPAVAHFGQLEMPSSRFMR